MKCALCEEEFELPVGSNDIVCGGCATELGDEEDAITAQCSAKSEAESYAEWQAEQLADLEEPELMEMDKY